MASGRISIQPRRRDAREPVGADTSHARPAPSTTVPSADADEQDRGGDELVGEAGAPLLAPDLGVRPQHARHEHRDRDDDEECGDDRATSSTDAIPGPSSTRRSRVLRHPAQPYPASSISRTASAIERTEGRRHRAGRAGSRCRTRSAISGSGGRSGFGRVLVVVVDEHLLAVGRQPFEEGLRHLGVLRVASSRRRPRC